MAYEYEDGIIKQHLSNFRSKTGKLIDTKESLELREVYAKAKAFNKILEAYKDSSEQDRLVGIFEGQVTTILDEYMEDK